MDRPSAGGSSPRHYKISISMNAPTVFVVDNNPEVCSTIRQQIESLYLPVETFLSGNAFLAEYSIYRVGCLLVDLHMPGMDGLELQRRLNECKYRLPIIFMTSRGDIRSAVRAIKGGAMDYLEKPLSIEQLEPMLQNALKLDQKRQQARLKSAAIKARVDNLTPRERQVLNLVVHQQTNKNIARNLGVSIKTVEFHRSRVMQKMHAHSLLELAEMVRENGGAETTPVFSH